MKIAIVCRGDDNSKNVASKLLSKLKKEKAELDDISPQVVIFVGGDGTFLRAVNQYLDNINEISFIGIHTGTLGFFCDFSLDELDEVVRLVLEEKPYKKHYRLLEACLTTDIDHRHFYAVNEIRIENAQHTIISDVYIDDVFFENI